MRQVSENRGYRPPAKSPHFVRWFSPASSLGILREPTTRSGAGTDLAGLAELRRRKPSALPHVSYHDRSCPLQNPFMAAGLLDQ